STSWGGATFGPPMEAQPDSNRTPNETAGLQREPCIRLSPWPACEGTMARWNHDNNRSGQKQASPDMFRRDRVARRLLLDFPHGSLAHRRRTASGGNGPHLGRQE